MALKNFNPVTPGTRQLVLVDRSSLWRGVTYKGLSSGLVRSGGRNNTGRITSWQREAVGIRGLIGRLILSVVNSLDLRLWWKE